MMKRTKVILLVLTLGLAIGFLTAGCTSKADSVNHNLDTDAEQFKVYRHISFINGITDKEDLRIEGYCSNEYSGNKIDVTCKVPGGYVRDTLTKADNVYVVSQQIAPDDVSDTHYKLILRPGTVIPNIDIQ